jgi:hypothetical protein
MRAEFSAPYGDGFATRIVSSPRPITAWRDVAGRRTPQQFVADLSPSALTVDELAECLGIRCRDLNAHLEDTDYTRLAQALLDEVTE